MTCGQYVWCVLTFKGEPVLGKYVEEMSDDVVKSGYRAGHIVEINGQERWVRSDWCSPVRDDVLNVKF